MVEAFFFLSLFPTLVFMQLNRLYQVPLSLQKVIEICSTMEVEPGKWLVLNFVFNFGEVAISYEHAIYPSLLYMVLALPCALSGALIWRRWRHARSTALLVQILALALALALYANRFHPYLYGVLAVGVVAVFYLNLYEVKVAFR